MRKVMCINNKPIPRSLNQYNHLLKEGGIYTVSKYYPEQGYDLKEIILPDPHSFSSKRFIPLSEIDEKEMVREYNVVTNL